MAGTVTAFCGPIAFLGIITPHLARTLFKTSDHKILLPSTMMLGVIIALLSESLISSLSIINLPLNAVMGLIGTPVIFLFFWSQKREEL